jgi:hypothetical protein
MIRTIPTFRQLLVQQQVFNAARRFSTASHSTSHDLDTIKYAKVDFKEAKRHLTHLNTLSAAVWSLAKPKGVSEKNSYPVYACSLEFNSSVAMHTALRQTWNATYKKLALPNFKETPLAHHPDIYCFQNRDNNIMYIEIKTHWLKSSTQADKRLSEETAILIRSLYGFKNSENGSQLRTWNPTNSKQIIMTDDESTKTERGNKVEDKDVVNTAISYLNKKYAVHVTFETVSKLFPR